MSRTAFILTLGLTLGTGLLFWVFPNLDPAAARFFYVQDHFVGRGDVYRDFRLFFYYLPVIPLVLAGGFFIAARAGVRVPPALVPTGASLAFLVASMALGPGVLVNLALKDHWHRPRPVQVQEFGGRMDYRPFWKADGACDHNCSFVSGETSAAFWLVAPASLAPPPWRGPAIAAALLAGVVTGGLRMAFGGHFLSDVVFAGLFTLLLIQILHAVFRRGLRKGAPPL